MSIGASHYESCPRCKGAGRVKVRGASTEIVYHSCGHPAARGAVVGMADRVPCPCCMPVRPRRSRTSARGSE